MSDGAARRYRFCRLRAAADLPLIAAWLRLPHVQRWWGDPADALAEIRQNLAGRYARPYLVSLSGRPFAYIQCYDPRGNPPEASVDQPPGTRGIDFFIGEADMVGCGHGSAMLAQFVGAAFRHRGVTRVISDPDPANMASIHALSRAGFAVSGTIVMPFGKVLLMQRDRVPKRSA